MTKKFLLFITIGCLMAGTVHAQKVQWKTIEQAAKTETKSNAKLFFVDFYTSWCGWCKKMDKETFSNPTVALILNTYYIPVKFDAESSTEFTWYGEKYSNTAVAPGAKRNTHNFAKKVLGARMGFPSFGVFKTNQQQLTVIQGYYPPEDFIVVLWYYASGDNARYSWDRYQKIFDKEIRPVMNQKLGIK